MFTSVESLLLLTAIKEFYKREIFFNWLTGGYKQGPSDEWNLFDTWTRRRLSFTRTNSGTFCRSSCFFCSSSSY